MSFAETAGREISALPPSPGTARLHSESGWTFERIALPLAPNGSARLRFKFSGLGQITLETQDTGWWIDDVYVGTTEDPTRILVSDFEEDARQWKELLTEFDRSWGFTVVEDVYVAIDESAFPDQVSPVDAYPTYQPGDVLPEVPEIPFPDRPVEEQPYVVGSAGGWPKSLAHGVLGSDDADTVAALGQPFLQRDAAFHPAGNPLFDDGVDYRGRFAEEFVAHRAPQARVLAAGY